MLADVVVQDAVKRRDQDALWTGNAALPVLESSINRANVGLTALSCRSSSRHGSTGAAVHQLHRRGE